MMDETRQILPAYGVEELAVPHIKPYFADLQISFKIVPSTRTATLPASVSTNAGKYSMQVRRR